MGRIIYLPLLERAYGELWRGVSYVIPARLWISPRFPTEKQGRHVLAAAFSANEDGCRPFRYVQKDQDPLGLRALPREAMAILYSSSAASLALATGGTLPPSALGKQ